LNTSTYVLALCLLPLIDESFLTGEGNLQGREQRSLEHGQRFVSIGLLVTDRVAQMLEFCQTVKPSLEDYEADGVRLP
jgi:hypothetical protein